MSKESAYRLLGLEPGADARDVKSAYRDLAKVWHPDRFAGDPRLQRKAQEKLKEINEAYAEINSPSPSRHRQRAAHDAPRTDHARPRPAEGAAQAAGKPARASHLIACAAASTVVALALFASLASFRPNEAPPEDISAVAPAPDEQAGEMPADDRGESKSTGRRKATEGGPAVEVPGRGSAASAATAAPSLVEPDATVRPLPTVTRTIDPLTGLLATRACPVKSPMTYPGGQEPRRFCDADHGRKGASASRQAGPSSETPAGESRVKTVIDAVTSPGKLFRKKKEKPAGDAAGQS